MRFLALLLLLSYLSLSAQMYDFRDPYDYNLNQYSEEQGFAEDTEEEYTNPPEFKKPPLSQPHKPLKPEADNLYLNYSDIGSRTTIYRKKENETPFNPYTGEINYELVKQQALEKSKKSKKKKDFSPYHREKYHESASRRFSIIFLLTFPFSLLLSYGIATAGGFEATPSGAAFTAVGSIGLASWNAWYDKRYIEKHPANEHNPYSFRITAGTLRF